MHNDKHFDDSKNDKKDVEQQMPHDSRTKKVLYDMDEAISKTKFGLFNYVVIGVTGLILFAAYVETVCITYVLPVLCDMNLTASQKGVLSGAAYFGVICSSHLFGFLADTKGRRFVVLPALLAAFLVSIICSLAQNVYVFASFRFLSGFLLSAAGGNIYAYLGEFHNNVMRSRAIMTSAVIFSTLCIALPVSAWAVINQDWQFQVPLIDLTYKPWRLFFIVCSIPSFLSGLALVFLPESPKFVLGQGNKMKAYQILERMHRWNNGKNAKFELFEIREEIESIERRRHDIKSVKSQSSLLKTVWNQTAPLFKPPFLKSTILICTIQFGMFSTSHGFAMFFADIVNKMSANLNDFYDERKMMCDTINMNSANVTMNGIDDVECKGKLELSTVEVGLTIEIIFAIGSALAGLLIYKIGKFPIILFISLSAGLSAFGCMVTDIPALQIVLFIWLFTCGITTNVVSSATVELYPTALRAMAMSISLMFGRLGAVAGSHAAAILLDDHCETTFYLSASVLSAMGVLAFFIPNIHKKATKSEQDQVKCDSRPSVLSFGGSMRGF